MRLFLTLLVVSLTASAYTHAQDILQLAWDFNGNAGNELSVSAQVNNVNLETSAITRGPGLSTASLSNSFNSTGWTTTNSLQDAISANDYLQFTVRSRSSFIVSLSLLESIFRRSGTGPDHFQWMISLNGLNFSALGSEIVFTGTATNGSVQPMIDLTAVPSVQNVGSGDLITFRLYGYNAASAGGSFAFGRLAGNDIALSGSVQAVAPVILRNFSSTVVNKQIVLRWRSMTEAHHEYYVIERSADGKTFQEIGKLRSRNDLNGAVYEFTDPGPLPDMNYYRLKMVDINNYFEYSPVCRSRMKDITPAPLVRQLGDKIIVDLQNEQGFIFLLDLSGKLIIKNELKTNASPFVFNVSFLPRGHYVLVVNSRKGNYSQVIQRR